MKGGQVPLRDRDEEDEDEEEDVDYNEMNRRKKKRKLEAKSIKVQGKRKLRKNNLIVKMTSSEKHYYSS